MRLFAAIAGLLGFAGAALGAEIPFGTLSSIPSASNDLRQIVTADLDRDGDLDIAAVSQQDDRLSWYENVAGSFVERTVSSTVDGAVSVFVGDIDDDGRQDLVSAATESGEILWYCNDGGSPTLFSAHPVGTLGGLTFVSAADLDRDGDLDVIASSTSGLSWYENDGTLIPSFAPHALSAEAAEAVEIADLDRDGDLDVLAAQPGLGRVVWFASDGANLPSFAAPAEIGAIGDPRSLATVDLDRDGDRDVLVASTADHTVVWLENNGATPPAFVNRTISTSAGGPSAITASDLDRDGDSDVLVAASTVNRIVWFENNGTSSPAFTERIVESTVSSPRSVVAADLDADGDRDVVRAAATGDTVGWLVNETIHRKAAFLPRRLLPSGGEDAWGGVGDIDRDGDADLLLPSDGSPALSWYERDHSAPDGYVPHVIDDLPLTDKTISSDLTDIDGDGDLDVWLVAWWLDEFSEAVGFSAWYENSAGNGSTWVVHPLGIGPAQRPVGGDLDDDGDRDVVLGLRIDVSTWSLIWLENDGGSPPGFTVHTAVTPWLYPDDIRLVDLDTDGDLDILSLSIEPDVSWEGMAWFENDGSSSPVFTKHTISIGPVTGVYSGDLDNDGDQDVVSASYHSGLLTWHENNSASPPGFIEHILVDASQGADPYSDLPGWVYASDSDADGDLDLVVGKLYNGPIFLYENDGQVPPSFGAGRIIGESDAPLPVRTADLDGDGDEDLLATSLVSYERPSAWYPNRGGQLALSTIPHADFFALGGSAIELQPLVATHAGRPGDGDVELVRIDLLFEEDEGDPLSTSEVNALIEELSIYRDDGSGVFEVTGDTLVAELNSLTLTDGIQAIAFADGDPNVRIVHGSPATYFVVAELTASAADQTPNRFRFTHQTEDGGAAEDRDHDLPLELQATAHLPSGYYTAVAGVAGSTSGLQIQKVTSTRIHLLWDASCSGMDIDYAIFRGFMTDFTAHASLHCTTGGALDQDIGLGPGDLYYLIVPTDGLVDGSYGQGQDGERPVGVQVCRTQSLATCP